MSLDLVVPNQLGTNLGGVQQVSDQNNNPSALYLSSNSVKVKGQDICGFALPVFLEQNTSGMTYTPALGPNNTLGRFIRFANNTSTGSWFYDVGIDQNGNLFINGNNSANGPTNAPILKISQQGEVTITGDLIVQGRIFNPGVQTLGGDTISRLAVSTILGGKIGMG